MSSRIGSGGIGAPPRADLATITDSNVLTWKLEKGPGVLFFAGTRASFSPAETLHPQRAHSARPAPPWCRNQCALGVAMYTDFIGCVVGGIK